MSNKMALDALTAAQRAINSMKVEAETAGAGGDQEMLQDACEQISNEGLAADTAIRAAIAALQAEPQDGDVEQALNRMDALLDPSLNLLAVSEDSITLQGCRADMLTIRRALRMAPAAREGWQPIETAPKDGTDILLAIIDAEHSYIDHVERGYFEVVAEDEEDGPWDIRNGEPWCSYEGRSEGLYWCYACGPDDFNRRGIRFLDCSDCLKYTHWMPLPATPPKD